MIQAPILHTDRLILRPHRASDYAACQALWSNADVVRHIGGTAQDAQAVWFRLLRYAGMWSMLGYGMWAMEDRTTGAFVGEAGLLSAARSLPELDGVLEAGWVLDPSAWGRGVATEAMLAALDWTDASLDRPAIRCIIEPDNAASLRIADKLGFLAITDTVLGSKPIRVLERRPASRS